MEKFNTFVRDYGTFVQYRIFERCFSGDRPSYVEDNLEEWQDVELSWEDIINGKLEKEITPIVKMLPLGEEKKKYLESLSPTERNKFLLAEKERSFLNSLKRTKDKIYDYAQSNEWEYMITLSFKDGKIPFPYPEKHEEIIENMEVVKKWLDNIQQRKYKDREDKLRYIIIPELGEKTGRFHLHGLIANVDGITLNRSAEKRESYNIKEWKKGWSSAVPIYDNVGACNYILKYITKDLCVVAPSRSRYLHSKGLKSCEVKKELIDYEEQRKIIFDNMCSDRLIYHKCIKDKFGGNITYIAIKKE